MELDCLAIARKGAKQLVAATGLPLSTVTSVAAAEAGWRIEVELLEKQAIPNSMDILGRYHVFLDANATLISFERKGLRKRGDTDQD